MLIRAANSRQHARMKEEGRGTLKDIFVALGKAQRVWMRAFLEGGHDAHPGRQRPRLSTYMRVASFPSCSTYVPQRRFPPDSRVLTRSCFEDGELLRASCPGFVEHFFLRLGPLGGHPCEGLTKVAISIFEASIGVASNMGFTFVA